MKKILITGAAGFVGAKLCKTLERRGLPFTAAVRSHRQPDQYEVGDICGTTDWSAPLAGCDTVIHLAARVHVMRDQSPNPLADFRSTNVDATINLAKQAVREGVVRFVFVSSIKVNGEKTTDRPFTSEDQPAPIDPYGQSKLEAEIALSELSRATGLEVVIVRPPLIYGPGVRANFRSLMRLVQLGIPLPLGAIHNRRSMVALDNLVDLLIVCSRHADAAGNTFLVSDDSDVSITELMRMLASSMGKRSLLLPIPDKWIAGAAVLLGKSDLSSRMLDSLQVDISKTKHILNWKPIVCMQEELNKTVSHFLYN